MKSKWFSHLLLLGLVLVIAIPTIAAADTIFSTTAGVGWRNGYAVNENGYPYWDNRSWDGAQRNIGYFLTQTGYFSGLAPYEHPGAVPYWGNTSGGFDPNFFFTHSSGKDVGAMRLELAGYASFNSFGWYDTSDGSLHEIFAGIDHTGDTETFTPSASYGFYLINKPGAIFKTQSQGSSDPGQQHFAVFQEYPNTYWLGIEDLMLQSSDKDYNDMVVKVTNVLAPVPEPGTLILLGFALLGLAGMAWRRQRR